MHDKWPNDMDLSAVPHSLKIDWLHDGCVGGLPKRVRPKCPSTNRPSCYFKYRSQKLCVVTSEAESLAKAVIAEKDQGQNYNFMHMVF